MINFNILFQPIRIEQCPHGHHSFIFARVPDHMDIQPTSPKLMSNRRDSKDSENSEKPARKRVRDNHNELERVRRNNQKAQLEALRMALPFQDMDDKASMVSIFVRAREYIGMLEQRIIELQGGAQQVGEYSVNMIPVPTPPKMTLHIPSPLKMTQEMTMPQVPNSPNFGRPREFSVNSDQLQAHHGISFYNPGFMNNSNNLSMEMSALITPISSPIQKSTSPSYEPSVNAEILRNFVADNVLKYGATQRLSTEEENIFLRNFRDRRISSLLMPMEYDTVMIQKRDSLSALFSGLLPDFVDSSVINNGDGIKCHRCQKGMNNMIMIDCDKCHKWYHIKCARIDSDAIPTSWNCC